MKNRVRIVSDSGSFDILTEGTAEEFKSVFGDEYAKAVLAPTARFVPLPLLETPAQPPAIAPTPSPVGYFAPTVVQPQQEDVNTIANRMRELELEVEQAAAYPQPVYAQPHHYAAIPGPNTPTIVQLPQATGIPAIAQLRRQSTDLLTTLKAWKVPLGRAFDVSLIIVLAATLPFTQPFVKGIPFVGQPIVGTVQGTINAIMRPEVKKPAVKPSPPTKAKQ